MKRPQINEQRLWRSMMDMAELGALPNGGSCRTALSPEDKAGRDLFVRWCQKAACEVVSDQVGNIFARRQGSALSLPAVATGSHLDTQPHGGKFDGIYGVLAGLEVVRALNDAQIISQAPIDVIVWTNEEGVRFSPPLAGSSAFAGKFSVAQIHESVTTDGTTVFEDLRSTAYLGDEVPGSRQFNCFLEAHIEQGPILEAEQRTIGIVTKVQGIRWRQVTVTGQDGHAGTTPMNKRRDALLGAAKMVDALNHLARAEDDLMRLTVGRMNITPNSGATICGQVRFVVDFRHPQINTLNKIERQLIETVQRIGEGLGLSTDIESLIDADPVPFDDELTDCVRRHAQRLGYRHMDMLSGAGHDAMNLAGKTASTMIFVPCKDGISHNEAESAKAEDLAAGADVLLHTILERAGVSP
jgi:N-carbamoyl-L-amino-acid hydrolase